ncbi:hypothetical protein IWQ60_009374 [Tieghemiomyces parasiticus]|uniref:PH domain-containing protein n=1 Tax=Tieghemiomyces parasiticus TaxID=78921 RepID=A0A9W7ZPH0_9FUNG|nr:hypothetical protein IWQ60_009374 [Tieghemiomyces parasiticus]
MPTVSDMALKKFQLVEALRSGDHEGLRKALQEWSDDHQAAQAAESPQGTTHGESPVPFASPPVPAQVTPLHLAIQFATKTTIEFILSLQARDLLNSQDSYGWTALHHAAKTGRTEVVRLLLAQPGIDDLVLDHEGRDPLRVAKTPAIADLIKGNRLDFIAKHTEEMHELTRKGDVAGLDTLFLNVRSRKLIDINAPNPENHGNTVVHEAVETKDLDLVKWWCNRGADVFVRNERGKLPADLTADARTVKLLETAPVATLRPTSPGKAPRLQGYLLKWTNFASGYKRRYFVLENGVLSYYKDKADASNACRGAINLKIANINFDAKDQTTFDVQGKGSVRYRLRAEYPVEAKRWALALTQSKQWALDSTEPSRSVENLTLASRRPAGATSVSNLSTSGFGSVRERPAGEAKSVASDAEGPSTSRDDLSRRSSNFPTPDRTSQAPSAAESDGEDGIPVPPHEESLELNANALQAQIVAQEQLFEAATASLAATSPGAAQKLVHAHQRSVRDLRHTLSETLAMGREREQFWYHQYQRETERQNVLAESFRSLILEQDQLEKVMRAHRRRTKGPSAAHPPSVPTGVLDGTRRASEPVLTSTATPPTATVHPADDVRSPITTDVAPPTATAPAAVTAPPAGIPEPAYEDTESDDDDDMFYDFEEAEELVPEPVSQEVVPARDSRSIAASYAGYPADGHFRQALHPGSAKPPSISFWSILKNAIGKDLTKISMPVAFNEPNSMLQRMAEDMEYSDLLDMAVRHPHSSERILFVAAWAMSNYSSTMGRVAKPFNPLLGETFEYVRPDKAYRYVSEQVSHHPPISACYCDGPNYNFYAEVNVRSKFYGKSFEICPLGVSHVELKVPLHMLDPKDPAQPKVIDREGGYFIEHYSWKKVITSVQGLIAGNPWMEHYGDMDLVNHRTGETCRLNFKQTGWRGNNLYVIEGKSCDPQGTEQWEIAGKWNERLIARRINKGSRAAPLSEKDVAADADVQSIASSTRTKPILLWRADSPPNPPLPFNLTRFAVTLNDMTPGLQPILCPTDSRLRPDQRAMEFGDYDKASDLKTALEENQRARRRAREEDPAAGEWQARWFTRDIETDTNEPYWRFDPQYWTERNRAAQAAAKGEDPNQVAWKGITHIFEVNA